MLPTPIDIHLQQDVVDVVRLAEDVPEGPASQLVEVLNRLDRALQNVKHGSV